MSGLGETLLHIKGLIVLRHQWLQSNLAKELASTARRKRAGVTARLPFILSLHGNHRCSCNAGSSNSQSLWRATYQLNRLYLSFFFGFFPVPVVHKVALTTLSHIGFKCQIATIDWRESNNVSFYISFNYKNDLISGPFDWWPVDPVGLQEPLYRLTTIPIKPETDWMS